MEVNDALLLALHMGEGATSEGIEASSRSKRVQGSGFSAKSLRGNPSLKTHFRFLFSKTVR